MLWREGGREGGKDGKYVEEMRIREHRKKEKE